MMLLLFLGSILVQGEVIMAHCYITPIITSQSISYIRNNWMDGLVVALTMAQCLQGSLEHFDHEA